MRIRVHALIRRGEGNIESNQTFRGTATWSVAHGPDGDIYLGDAAGRIRKIDTETGRINTVAGGGIQGYTGDGGPAAKARIGTPV